METFYAICSTYLSVCILSMAATKPSTFRLQIILFVFSSDIEVFEETQHIAQRTVYLCEQVGV